MRIKEILEEIERQKTELSSKGIKPELLLLGDMSYYMLKMYEESELKHFDNSGSYLTEFSGLNVIKKPNLKQGSCIDRFEDFFIKVYGI
jgi:hypothetical protein